MRHKEITKLICAFLVCALVVFTFLLIPYFNKPQGKYLKEHKGNFRKIELALKEQIDKSHSFDSQSVEKAYQAAILALSSGSVKQAEEKLKYISSEYPLSKRATKAREILGEINLDRLLNPEWEKNKNFIIVQKGDNLTKIVKENNTSLDNLIHLSKLILSDQNNLKVGDKLAFLTLNFHAVIDTRRKTLTLFNEKEFIKDYKIKKIALEKKPSKNKRELKLIKIQGWHGGRFYPNYDSRYRASIKMIQLSEKQLAIRTLQEEEEENYGLGFFLDKADMEELPLLLRPGNTIEIRY